MNAFRFSFQLLTCLTLFLFSLLLWASPSPAWQGMHIALPAKEKASLIYRFEHSNPQYLALVKRSAKNVKVRLAKKNDPMGGNFTTTNIDDKGTTFEVVLQRSNFAGGNLLGIHLQYHEFGHVIVNSWATEQTYERLFSYWSASSLWQSCYPQSSDAIDPCVSLDEIAADQFAFWAGSKKATRSSYNLPPLGTAAKMTKILKEDGLIARSRH